MRIPPRRRRGWRPARLSCRAGWTAASATASTDGSPSAAASAPTMTRLTNFDPAGERLGGHAADVEPVELRRHAVAVQEHEAVRREAVGDVDLVQQRRLQHDDDVGVRDRVVTPDRLVVDAGERAQRSAAPLGPVLRKRLDALAGVQQRRRISCDAVFAPCPARACQRISFMPSLARGTRGRRARRSSPRGRPRRPSRRRCTRRLPRSSRGSTSRR